MAKDDFAGDSSDSTNSRRLSGQSAFLSAGRLSLYTENAFRVLGMPVDASDIELQERHGVLKTYATLKRTGEVYTIAFALNPPPSANQIDSALERLNEGEERASDEFFWFWPREIDAPDDPGLEAIADGDEKEALRVWREWEQESDERVRAIARHNLAVNYLVLALEETARHLAGSAAKSEEQLKNAWKNAGKKWGEVAGSRYVWDETRERILSKGDPALTATLADEMKAGLHKTLAAIHGDIARHYAEKGKLEWAKFHIDAMFVGSRDNFDDDYRATVREVTKPVRDRLEAARTQAQSYADSSEQDEKKQAFGKVQDFFENDFEKTAKPVLDLFYANDGELQKEKERLYDKVVETVRACCVAAFNAKQKAKERTDNDTALLKKALDVTADLQLKRKIEEAITEPIEGIPPELQEVWETIVEVVQEEGSPSKRFRKLQDARRKLKAWVSKNPGRKQECNKLLTALAKLERSLSVDLHNEEDDTDFAIIAIKCAIEDTPDADDREKFEDDLTMLQRRKFLRICSDIAESKEAARQRFADLMDIRDEVHRWEDSRPESDEECRKFMTVYASLERSFSVSVYNEGMEEIVTKGHANPKASLESVIKLAFTAICNAIEDMPDKADREKFRKDYDQLAEAAKQFDVHPIPPKPDRRERISDAEKKVQKTFDEVAQEKGSPSARFRKLQGVRPDLKALALKSKNSKREQEIDSLLKKFATLERSLSEVIYNEEDDIDLAMTAVKCAIKDTPDAADRKQFRIYLVILQRKKFHKGRLSWALNLTVTLFFLSFIFRHYYPSGMAFTESFMLQWWYLPAVGFVAGLLLPLGKLPFPFPVSFMAFNSLGCFYTLVIWVMMLVYNAIVSEASAAELWWAPLVGFGISFPAAILYYAALKKAGER